jgi:flagellar basal-body rod protein FlgF
VVPAVPPEPIVDTAGTGLLQGYIEDSNVNPVMEMSRLIMVSRAFENTTAMTRATEDVFKEAIRTLGSGQ